MILVCYRCACFQPGAERQLEVTERGKDEDVLVWMTQVRRVIWKDHGHVSPLCARDNMEYLKVPYDEDVPVGSVPTLN